MRKDTYRILAQGELRNNNTRVSGINNNDLIVGVSGAGKTRNYVKPNLMQGEHSFVVADTKGNLIREVGPLLEKNGYKVLNIDFTDMKSSYGYNPFDFIRYDEMNNKYSEQDIMTIADCLVPVENGKDPFWDYAAKMYISCMIAYVLECLPENEHNLASVCKLVFEMSNGRFGMLIDWLNEEQEDSMAVRKYKSFCCTRTAEKMHASICGIIAEKLDPLTYDEAVALYRKKKRINFKDLGKVKTVLFLTISDTDRSNDKLVNLLYTQALQELCKSADKDYEDNRLQIPVRFILDDFATNAYIPNFDKTISVIRSREIYVSIILQSLSQLEDMYGHAKMMTIINNCDNFLYLGGQDVETVRYIAVKANKTADTILNMPLNEAYLFTRGSLPKKVQKYDIKFHEKYCQLPEAQGSKFYT